MIILNRQLLLGTASLLLGIWSVGCQKTVGPYDDPAADKAPILVRGPDKKDGQGLILPWPAQKRMGSARGGFRHEIRDMAAGPKGTSFALAVGKQVMLLDSQTQDPRAIDLPCRIHRLTWDKAGQRIAAICRETLSDGDEPERTVIVSASEGKRAHDFRAPEALVAIATVVLEEKEQLLLGARSGKLYLADFDGKVKKSWSVFKGRASDILSNTFVALQVQAGSSTVLAIGDEANALVNLSDPESSSQAVSLLTLPENKEISMGDWLPQGKGQALLVTNTGLEMWDLSKEPRARAGAKLKITDSEGESPFWLSVSADGLRAMTLDNDNLRTFALDKTKIRPLAQRALPAGLADISADGQKVLSTASIPMVYHMLDSSSLSLPPGRHTTPISHFAQSPDGSLMASLDFDGQLLVRQTSDGQMRKQFKIDPPSQGGLVAKRMYLGWHGPDRLLLGHSKRHQLIQLSTGDIKDLEHEHWHGVEHLRTSQDGQRLITMTRFGGEVALWNSLADQVKLVWSSKFKTRGLGSITPCRVGLSADGSAFFVAAKSAYKGQVTVYDGKGKELNKFDTGPTCHAALSGDGKRLAFADDKGRRVRVVEVSSGREIAKIKKQDRSWEAVLAEISDLALDAKGRTLACIWQNEINLVPLVQPERAISFKSPFGSRQLQFLPDGRLLSGELTSLLFWQVQSPGTGD